MKSVILGVAAILLFGTIAQAHAQVRHYSRDEVPTLDELRQVLSRPLAPAPSRPVARSKAWLQDGQEEDQPEPRVASGLQVTSQQLERIPARAPVASSSAVMLGSPRSVSVEIVFKLNSDELDGRYASALSNIALVLIESAQSILIEGHTDASGSQELNASLSLRRANSVKAFLLGKGVPTSLIATRGVGASKLLDQGNPFASINRRVVFSAL